MPPVDDDALLSRWIRLQENVVLQHNDLALSTLANMVESGTIDVAPRFQRRDRWSNKKQSQLIESFVLNLPIPPVYLAEEDGGTYSVIDGRQRLTAIGAFLVGGLTLSGLTELPELNGYQFVSLPREIKGSLEMRPLRSATLLRQTDPEIKYLVFHRLNTAGEPLNNQEIRNVVHRGALNDLLFELAETPFLRQQLKIGNAHAPAYRKMQDVEYVLRFMTLNARWMNFSGDFSRSMDDFMVEHRSTSGRSLAPMRATFNDALGRCEALWGAHAFHRPDGRGWRAQALAGLYDAEMVAAAGLTVQQARRITPEHAAATLEMTRALFADREFDEAVRTGTNTPSRVVYRISKMIEGLQSVLGA